MLSNTNICQLSLGVLMLYQIYGFIKSLKKVRARGMIFYVFFGFIQKNFHRIWAEGRGCQDYWDIIWKPLAQKQDSHFKGGGGILCQ